MIPPGSPERLRPRRHLAVLRFGLAPDIMEVVRPGAAIDVTVDAKKGLWGWCGHGFRIGDTNPHALVGLSAPKGHWPILVFDYHDLVQLQNAVRIVQRIAAEQGRRMTFVD